MRPSALTEVPWRPAATPAAVGMRLVPAGTPEDPGVPAEPLRSGRQAGHWTGAAVFTLEASGLVTVPQGGGGVVVWVWVAEVWAVV